MGLFSGIKKKMKEIEERKFEPIVCSIKTIIKEGSNSRCSFNGFISEDRIVINYTYSSTYSEADFPLYYKLSEGSKIFLPFFDSVYKVIDYDYEKEMVTLQLLRESESRNGHPGTRIERTDGNEYWFFGGFLNDDTIVIYRNLSFTYSESYRPYFYKLGKGKLIEAGNKTYKIEEFDLENNTVRF